MGPLRQLMWGAVAWLFAFGVGHAQDIIRVATYNIQNFDSGETAERVRNVQQVLRLLDADVIGLQEIRDRAALHRIFDQNAWHLVVDDDNSGSPRNLALAVRRPLDVVGVPADLDADDEHFLFPEDGDDNHFPERRDVLSVEVRVPSQNASFFVLVVHAKSRLGGRANTDSRREGASRDLVDHIRTDFQERAFILLGDFNDNPDDRSMNILETGDGNALGGEENLPGAFMINLTEPRCAAGHVSHGRDFSDINPSNNRIDTIDAGSRGRNNAARGQNTHTGDILFDQLLIPAWMAGHYVQNSARVFNFPVAVEQLNPGSRASDHLPVSAEFSFTVEGDPTPPPTGGNARIVSALPNPAGPDHGNEEITIGNFTQSAVNLSGWKLRDAAQNEFSLSGVIPPHAMLTFIMRANSMPLNNNGDTVTLLNQQGTQVHQVQYSAAEAQPGVVVRF